MNLLNVVVWIYVEVRISRSISESPLEFEITRVDRILSGSRLQQMYMFEPEHKDIYKNTNSENPDRYVHL